MSTLNLSRVSGTDGTKYGDKFIDVLKHDAFLIEISSKNKTSSKTSSKSDFLVNYQVLKSAGKFFFVCVCGKGDILYQVKIKSQHCNTNVLTILFVKF